jgi:hypothetical protein
MQLFIFRANATARGANYRVSKIKLIKSEGKQYKYVEQIQTYSMFYLHTRCRASKMLLQHCMQSNTILIY